MKEKALFEVGQAESLLSHWRVLPGLQVKELVTHLVKALNNVSSFVLNDQSSIIERDYLLLSNVRLFSDVNVEHGFYDSYYFLMNLLRKEIHRVDEAVVKVSGPKMVFNADRAYFEGLINDVKGVVNSAFE